MRTTAFVVMCLALGLATAHPGPHAKPDAARLKRHAQKLSEACKRKGRKLDDACPLDPEVTAGPYVWSTAPIREDITEGYPGVPLELNVNVVNSNTCEDIEGAGIQVWHCDAGGVYSHFIAASTGTGTETDDSTFLRGLQYTNSSGTAKFTTIWPGWYDGRTTHVHVRVHFNITETDDGFTGGTIAHTGQLFFADEVVYAIATVTPYSENTAEIIAMADDTHYKGQGGAYGVMTLTEMYPGSGWTAGVIGTVTLGVDTDATTTTPTPSTPATPSPTSTNSNNNNNGGSMGGGGRR